MGQSFSRCPLSPWEAVSTIVKHFDRSDQHRDSVPCVLRSLRYLLNQSSPEDCWQSVIAPTRSVAFTVISLRFKLITQQIISLAGCMTYSII